MIRERKEEDTDAIVEVWYSAFSLAHPFIENAFKEKVKKDMRELYIPNADMGIGRAFYDKYGFKQIKK